MPSSFIVTGLRRKLTRLRTAIHGLITLNFAALSFFSCPMSFQNRSAGRMPYCHMGTSNSFAVCHESDGRYLSIPLNTTGGVNQGASSEGPNSVTTTPTSSALHASTQLTPGPFAPASSHDHLQQLLSPMDGLKQCLDCLA